MLRRHLMGLPVLLLGALVLLAVPARAQLPGFLCSAGPRDGQGCEADADCLAPCPSTVGACVLGQAICDGGEFDGFPCDCPGGTCVGGTATGTCRGGPFDGDACTTTGGEGSCEPGRSCVLAHRVCNGGEFRGYGCIREDQCPGAQCRSTGRYCDGGDFDLFSCVVNADCGTTTTGQCLVPENPCPTTTPTPPVTGVPGTSTPATPGPTQGTPTPGTTSAPGSPTRTRTAAPTSGPEPSLSPTPVVANTPTATPTATLARNSFRLRQPAPAGSILLEVSNGNRMPPGADSITAINGSPVCIKFNRREDQLALGKPLDEPLTEADQIEVGTCGEPVAFEATAQACAIRPGTSPLACPLGIGGLVLVLARRRRP